MRMPTDDPADLPNVDLALIEALPQLFERFGVTPSYQTLWLAAVSGRVPAHRIDGKLRIRRADLPEVAAVFARRTRAEVARNIAEPTVADPPRTKRPRSPRAAA
jgi:hypothetical protein